MRRRRRIDARTLLRKRKGLHNLIMPTWANVEYVCIGVHCTEYYGKARKLE